jgi:hypothetical protein
MIALRFVASFVLISLPLTWFWVEGGWNSYAQLLNHVGGPIYSLVGLEELRIPARDRYINLIPFIALVIATPGLVLRRRLIGLLAGAALLFVSHLVINAVAELSGPTRALPPTLSTFSDALPLAIWAVIARHFILDMTRSVSSPIRRAQSTDESG